MSPNAPNVITIMPEIMRVGLLASNDRDRWSSIAAATRFGKVPKPNASMRIAPLSALPLSKAVNSTV